MNSLEQGVKTHAPLSKNSVAKSNRRPPGPANPWLGIGHIQPMQDDLVRFVRRLAEIHGDFVRYRIGPVCIYQVSHPEAVQEILSQHAAAFEKPRYMQGVFRPWVGRGLLFSEGDRWRRQRRLAEEALRNLKLPVVAEIIVRRAEQHILSKGEGEFDLTEACEDFAFYALLEIILGVFSPDISQQAYRDATFLQRDGMLRTSTFTQLPRWLPTPYNWEFRRVLKRFKDVFHQRLAARRTTKGEDYLSALIAAESQSEDEFSVDEVVHGATNILFGGKETGAASLYWPIYLLARHPDVQERAAEETARVLQGRRPQAEDIKHLTYLEMVFKEAIRIYPPVPMIMRQAISPMDIAGYTIPRGSQLYIATILLHRDPRWHEAPEAFRPERFESQNQKSLTPFTYIPFGAGPHICVGRRQAIVQAVLVLASMLQEFRVSLPADHQEPKLKVDERLHPVGPLRVIFERR